MPSKKPYRTPTKPVPFEEKTIRVKIQKSLSTMLHEVGERLREGLPEGREARWEINFRLKKFTRMKEVLILEYQIFQGAVEGAGND